MSPEEKVKILLHEYTTLRQEIIARTGHGFQLLSVGAIVLAWIIGSHTSTILFWFGLAIAVLVYAFAIWFTVRDIGKAANRIRYLEHDINQRAGEDLLVWESTSGAYVAGFWGRSKPIASPAQQGAPGAPGRP